MDNERLHGPQRGPCDRSLSCSVQLRIILAFAATWLIWGSTYLAAAFAVQDMPPLMVAGTRNLLAGLVLYGVTRGMGGPRPTRRQWLEAAVVGVLLLGVGNGAVTWATGREPSGVVALVVSLVPLWLMVFGWIGRRGVRPSAIEVGGIALGLVGISLLVSTNPETVGSVSVLGLAVLVLSTIAWAVGSLYSRQLTPPAVPLMATGMEMLLGGVALFVASGAQGDFGSFSMSDMTTRGWLSLAYLVVFGSIIGFSAYKWLLGRVRPALVGTYAFVNPVVAVLLGWAFAGEAITPRLAAAVLLIVGAVAMISLRPYFSRR